MTSVKGHSVQLPGEWALFFDTMEQRDEIAFFDIVDVKGVFVKDGAILCGGWRQEVFLL